MAGEMVPGLLRDREKDRRSFALLRPHKAVGSRLYLEETRALAYSGWQERFGAKSTVIGSGVRLDGAD